MKKGFSTMIIFKSTYEVRMKLKIRHSIQNDTHRCTYRRPTVIINDVNTLMLVNFLFSNPSLSILGSGL